MTEKENKWIKFYPSLELPKERVSIAYDTHDERGYRFAYGYFQFYNGTCGCFWKDGNEQPKAVKAEDIKYWMPVPSLDVQEEYVSEDLDKAAESWIDDDNNTRGADYIGVTVAEDAFKAGARWQKQQMMKNSVEGIVREDSNGYLYVYAAVYRYNGFSRLDKVKAIIIKED